MRRLMITSYRNIWCRTSRYRKRVNRTSRFAVFVDLHGFFLFLPRKKRNWCGASTLKRWRRSRAHTWKRSRTCGRTRVYRSATIVDGNTSSRIPPSSKYFVCNASSSHETDARPLFYREISLPFLHLWHPGLPRRKTHVPRRSLRFSRWFMFK